MAVHDEECHKGKLWRNRSTWHAMPACIFNEAKSAAVGDPFWKQRTEMWFGRYYSVPTHAPQQQWALLSMSMEIMRRRIRRNGA
jgi:hypothetical protein